SAVLSIIAMADSGIWGTIPFPSGANDTDTEIAGGHLDLNTLHEFEYHLFQNNTLSNGTKCYLAFEPYAAAYVYPNGTFVNGTSCYRSLNPAGVRAKTGVAFAALYALALVFVLVNLRKHGRLFLPKQKRYFPISRRWQWYYGSIACACALIGLFTGIDIERYYVMQIPIILQVFFWFLLQMAAIALVWEAVRHWGSWCERQIIDADIYAFKDDDARAKFEFYIPLWFYLWWWLNFFMIVPRSWGNIQLQRSPEQTLVRAKPTATDVRFKVAAFCHLVCWLTIVASLFHSIKHYRARRRGLFTGFYDVIRAIPARFALILPLALVIVAYQALCAFDFDVSPLNAKGNVIAIFIGGYLPTLLILAVQSAHGFATPNEDRELLRQRRMRGDELDRELGIVHKPSWWRRLNGPTSMHMRDIIARNVREVNGDKEVDRKNTTADPFSDEAAVNEVDSSASSSTGTATAPGFDARARPMFSPYTGKSERRRMERTLNHAASLLFPNAEDPTPSREAREAELQMDGPPPSYFETAEASRVRTNSSGSTIALANAKPQQVKSMLDI
ncbi:hypothetical protein jhhlp_002649, partial [Lomentospora prolificans]